jgi:hypothetical protein
MRTIDLSKPSVRLCCALLLGATALAASGPELLPVDEASTRPDFFSFRAQVQRTIAVRDVTSLLAVVDPNIKNSFGGDDGLEKFRSGWKLDDADSELWDRLGTVLALGGAFQDKDTFAAPYTFAKWPNDVDSFEHVVLIGANVRIRAAPRPDAATVATMSFAILPRAREQGDDPAWTVVRIDQRTGYVASRFARSPIDYRAIFSFTGGGWRLVTFVAGD